MLGHNSYPPAASFTTAAPPVTAQRVAEQLPQHRHCLLAVARQGALLVVVVTHGGPGPKAPQAHGPQARALLHLVCAGLTAATATAAAARAACARAGPRRARGLAGAGAAAGRGEGRQQAAAAGLGAGGGCEGELLGDVTGLDLWERCVELRTCGDVL